MKDPVPIVQEAGWAPGPVWMGAQYLTATRTQSLDRPVHRVTILTANVRHPRCVLYNSNVLGMLTLTV